MNGYLLLVRVFMSAVFLFSGFDKLFDWAEAQREVVGFGLPMPAFLPPPPSWCSWAAV